MTTATLKRPQGININPSEEELDIDRMESTITLDDPTKEKILSKHRKRIAKKELGNAELKARIEKKDLEQKLEAAKIGTLASAFNEQKKQILKLLQASFFSAIIFLLILPTVLSFTHGYSIASMAERLGSPFIPAYILGVIFAGLFEGLMLGLVLQFAHKSARLTQYSAMAVIGIVTSVEVFKKGIDVLQLTDVIRLVGGIALIPVIKAYAGKIRDKAEGKGKKNYERLPEDIQDTIIKDCKYLKGELAKFQAIPTKTETRFNTKTGKTETKTVRTGVYKIDRFNFREYSNAKQIFEHSLKKVLVDNGIYTNTLWKQIPSKGKKGKGKTEENQIVNETVKESANQSKPEVIQPINQTAKQNPNQAEMKSQPVTKEGIASLVKMISANKPKKEIFQTAIKTFGKDAKLSEFEKHVGNNAELKAMISKAKSFLGNDVTLGRVEGYI